MMQLAKLVGFDGDTEEWKKDCLTGAAEQRATKFRTPCPGLSDQLRGVSRSLHRSQGNLASELPYHGKLSD